MSFTVEPGEVVSHGGIEAFNDVSFRLRGEVFFCRDDLLINSPMVRRIGSTWNTFQSVPEAFSGLLSTTTTFKGNRLLSVSIIRNPDPAFFSFF